jgi:hypothetical protein
MKLIESKTLGADAASIEFTSIPQTFTDLVFLVSARTNNDPDGLTYGLVDLSVNGSTANLSNRRLMGDGSGAQSQSSSNGLILISGSGNTANTFSNTSVYIANYAGSTAKSISIDTVNENNATRAWSALYATLWNQTSAITSIGFTATSSGNLVVGSTISLYGILKGSDGIVTTS